MKSLNHIVTLFEWECPSLKILKHNGIANPSWTRFIGDIIYIN